MSRTENWVTKVIGIGGIVLFFGGFAGLGYELITGDYNSFIFSPSVGAMIVGVLGIAHHDEQIYPYR